MKKYWQVRNSYNAETGSLVYLYDIETGDLLLAHLPVFFHTGTLVSASLGPKFLLETCLIYRDMLVCVSAEFTLLRLCKYRR